MGASLEPIIFIMRYGENHKDYKTGDSFSFSCVICKIEDVGYCYAAINGLDFKAREAIRKEIHKHGIKQLKFVRLKNNKFLDRGLK